MLLARMVDTIQKVANGFADGTAHHKFMGDIDDPFAYSGWKDSCLEYNARLNAWRLLHKKAVKEIGKGTATDDFKKEYSHKTKQMYDETFNMLSFGAIEFENNKEFVETIRLMENRIKSLEIERDTLKEDNKRLAKELKGCMEESQTPKVPAQPKADFSGFA
jgi:hypothetical protein